MTPEALRRNALWRRLMRSWFELTVSEQKVVLLVLFLFLLGLAVRTWRLVWTSPAANPTPTAVLPAVPPVR
jgi:hypothetical protein